MLVKSTKSKVGAELELDTSVIELEDFISDINAKSIFADISIHEVPIEDIVKELYRRV